MNPLALVVRSAGTNCDLETAHALELAGATCERLHINRLLENRAELSRFQLIAFPGGFSYGDDIAAGKILANQINHHLGDELASFVEEGKPIIGVCNGFQVLIKTRLLPGPLVGRSGQTCTLTHNDNGRFIDRWVHLSPRQSRCIWTSGLEPLDLPIAHGEGKFVPADDAIRMALWENHQVALVYTRPDGSPAHGEFPGNPNGSADDIAGICDATGLVFGLMPHPERNIHPTHHPAWSRQPNLLPHGPGLRIFRNAVEHVKNTIGAGV